MFMSFVMCTSLNSNIWIFPPWVVTLRWSHSPSWAHILVRFRLVGRCVLSTTRYRNRSHRSYIWPDLSTLANIRADISVTGWLLAKYMLCALKWDRLPTNDWCWLYSVLCSLHLQGHAVLPWLLLLTVCDWATDCLPGICIRVGSFRFGLLWYCTRSRDLKGNFNTRS